MADSGQTWHRLSGAGIRDVLEKHRHFLARLPGGRRATLSFHDLSGVDLAGADLTGADLTGADLSHADFSGVRLDDAKLTGAKLDGIKGLDPDKIAPPSESEIESQQAG